MTKVLALTGIIFLTACNYANADAIIRDHQKTVIVQKPYNIEICKDVNSNGDKTGDALIGAIIGGALGNNIKGEQNGGAIGALLGGMLAHQNSDATGSTRRVCNMTTRYNEEATTIYSHSTITFNYEGRQYTVRFQK